MEPKSLSDLPGGGAALVDALIATSHSLVCVLDPSGRILRFNRVCEEVTGYSSRELVGENARDWVIPPEERELFDSVLEEIWEAKRPSPQVGQWLARDGGRVTVAWSNMPLWNLDGSPACLVTAGLRIGERDRAEAEMQSLHTLLESRLGELTRLAAEQSALRRVATLVATETGPEAIFDAVSGEMARLVGSRSSAVFRYGTDASATVVGRYTEDGIAAFALGSSVSLEADSALARVYRTGAPIRIESYAGVEGDVGEAMRQLGFLTSVAAPIIVGESRWGAVVVTGEDAASLPSGTEHRLHQFAELISLAIVSAEAREELLASRARVVQAGDAERRRLQRNLHDGAQQRLVSLLLALRLARKKLVEGEDADGLLGAAVADAEAAVEELRELARGLHPAILTRDGLRLAVEVLGRRAPDFMPSWPAATLSVRQRDGTWFAARSGNRYFWMRSAASRPMRSMFSNGPSTGRRSANVSLTTRSTSSGVHTPASTSASASRQRASMSRLPMKPGTSLHRTGIFPMSSMSAQAASSFSGGRALAGDHLDDRNQMRRIPKMRADQCAFAFATAAHFRDAQTARGGEKQRAPVARAAKSAEQRRLFVQHLDDAIEHYVRGGIEPGQIRFKHRLPASAFRRAEMLVGPGGQLGEFGFHRSQLRRVARPEQHAIAGALKRNRGGRTHLADAADADDWAAGKPPFRMGRLSSRPCWSNHLPSQLPSNGCSGLTASHKNIATTLSAAAT